MESELPQIPSNLSYLNYNEYSKTTITFIFISTVLISVILPSIFIHKRNQKNRKNPKKWPLIGATIEVLINYHRLHDWLLDYLSESKTIEVPLPGINITYTADPENVEYILKTNFVNYPKGELFRSYMEILLGDGIFNSDGENWKIQRKTVSFEFASKNLRDFSTIVFRDYALKLSRILSQSSLCNDEIDMQELMMKMTLNTICKVGFGIEIGGLTSDHPHSDDKLPLCNHFAQAFDTATTNIHFRFVDPFWRIKRFLNVGSEFLLSQSIHVINEFTYSLIQKRKAEILKEEAKLTNKNGSYQRKQDILSRFIELSNNSENNVTDKNLRDVIINFVLAGRDTTASTLSWFIYMMIMNPNVADKLYSDLKVFEEDRAKEEKVSLLPYDPQDEHLESFTERLTQFASLLTYDSLQKLSYLHAAITETLRLYPAVPQDPKEVLKDDVLPDGTKVRAGAAVVYVPYAMGRTEYNWGPDVSSFDPDRWLKDGFFQNPSPFKFSAFQAGPRICLGKDSSYLQMKMTLAILCRFFDFHLVSGHPVMYGMTPTLSMKHGLKVTVIRRA